MTKIALFLLLFLFAAHSVSAQGELLATVRVSTPQLQRNDRRVFDQMETAIRDFLNNTKWTNDVYEPDERIKCNFIFTIKTEIDATNFEADLAVQAVRPVYGSGYETSLLSHRDVDVRFSYVENQPMDFQIDLADNSNLTAVLAFYSYIILALDYDSFSLYGGDSYLLSAQQIVTNIQNSSSNSSEGWRPGDGGKNRNRYWIAENLLNPRVKPMRAAWYTYHRKGLDQFMSKPDEAKNQVLAAMEDIEKVSIAYLNSMIVQMFANSKRDELVEMWKIAPRPQKDRIIQIMIRLDPANSQKYQSIGS